MTRPDWEISVALGQSPFAALSTLTWTDVSADVLLDPQFSGAPISLRRGRQSELGTVEAGTLSLTLGNNARTYDPTNTASAYYPNVRPMTRIRVRVRWPVTTGPWTTVWTGYVTAWQPEYPSALQAVVRVRAGGVFAALARAQTSVVSIPPGEYSDSAIATALNQIGWPATDYTHSSGLTNIASGSYLNLNALQYMQTIAATENGLFFEAANGFPTFQDRHYRINNTTVAGVFGNNGTVNTVLSSGINASVTTLPLLSTAGFSSVGGVVTIDSEQISYTGKTSTTLTGCTRGYHSTTAASHSNGATVACVELPYADLTFSYDEALLYNDIQITRAGGTLQEAIDTSSQADYGPRVLTQSGLYMDGDDESLGLAQWLLSYATPNLRATSIVVNGELSPGGLWSMLLARELSDKIEAIVRPPGGGFIDQYARIESVAHTIAPESHLITFQLSLANDDLYWILDDPVRSVLNATTRLAF